MYQSYQCYHVNCITPVCHQNHLVHLVGYFHGLQQSQPYYSLTNKNINKLFLIILCDKLELNRLFEVNCKINIAPVNFASCLAWQV